GQEYDSETGLYYYGARYYDPAIGRFISPDSIVQSPGDPQSLNRYSYCRNNP
ncbi:MAG: RHS repeat-associated core domain-containing protein, partial [Bacillota bacterium]